MQTTLSPQHQNSARGRRAGEILRRCVHCGFCNATCPTYELLGDELDGPRGRIHLMKQFFEGAAADSALQLHLDRCLSCRSCETTCPSGVQYGELLEIGRAELDEKFPRGKWETFARNWIGRICANRRVFAALVFAARACKLLLPQSAAQLLPPREQPWLPRQIRKQWPRARHRRKMLALAGCVQPALAANTNLAAARVLDRIGISLTEDSNAGCCGAVQLHTSDLERGRAAARALIDCWLPHANHVECFVMTASGCGLTVKEYPQLFCGDDDYARKAKIIAEKTFDISEILARELPQNYRAQCKPKRVAFHPPCTLQHGQKIRGVVEPLLRRAGHELCEVRDAHLCCGSAGTYSLLQPAIANRLRRDKQAALAAPRPQVICTANVGCQNHLAAGAALPVVHWVEML